MSRDDDRQRETERVTILRIDTSPTRTSDSFTDECLVCGEIVCGCATYWSRRTVWNSNTTRLKQVIADAKEHPIPEEHHLLQVIKSELWQRGEL